MLKSVSVHRIEQTTGPHSVQLVNKSGVAMQIYISQATGSAVHRCVTAASWCEEQIRILHRCSQWVVEKKGRRDYPNRTWVLKQGVVLSLFSLGPGKNGG